MIAVFQLLKDYFRRWWWIWIVFAPLQVVYFSTNNVLAKAIWPALLGFTTLQGDMYLGVGRIERHLPVPAKRLVTVWWTVSVVLGPVLYNILPAFVRYAMGLSGTPANNFRDALFATALGIGYAAAMVHVAVHVCIANNNKLPEGLREKISAIASLLIGFMGVLFFTLALLPQDEIVHINPSVFVSMGAIYAIASWLAVRRLLVYSVQRAYDVRTPRTKKRIYAVRFLSKRRRGFLFPWLLELRSCIATGLLVLIPLLVFLPRLPSPEDLPANAPNLFVSVPYSVLNLMAISMITYWRFEWHSSARVLNSLPFSRAGLTLYFLSFPMVALSAATTLVLAATVINPLVWPILPRLFFFYAILLGIAVLRCPFCLRFGSALPQLGAFLLCVFILSSDVNFYLSGEKTPVLSTLSFRLFIIFLGVIAAIGVYYLLGRSSACYRHQNNSGEMPG